jgi:threonine synthase
MKVVEHLADNYHVALLNSKNAWRIQGQESYSFEVAQGFDYDLADKVVLVPIGNAGNITAIMGGFLKLLDLGVIDTPPKIIGVQSEHADPVYKYYRESDPNKRIFRPVTVRPSVAQAAMIGNPVSMPRVIRLVEAYEKVPGSPGVFVVQVSEQEIMDCQLIANRNGHIDVLKEENVWLVCSGPEKRGLYQRRRWRCSMPPLTLSNLPGSKSAILKII